MLASLLYPYDDDAKELIEHWLTDLANVGCIARYMVDGASYIQITEWLKHQKIDKPTASKIPSKDEGQPIDSSNPRESSRTLSVGMEGKGKDQGNGMDQGGEKARASRSSNPSKPEGVSDQVWADFLQLRKAKKAPVTETVMSGAWAESIKAGLSLDEFLRVWVFRGSQGMQAEWITSKDIDRVRPQQPQAGPFSAAGMATLQNAKNLKQRLIDREQGTAAQGANDHAN